MTRILLDIRDFLIGALIVEGDAILYDGSFDSRSIDGTDPGSKEPASLSTTLFRATGGGENVLSAILTRIMKESGIKVSSGYLLVTDSFLIAETITLPKIKPADSRRIVERKLNPTGALQLQVTLQEESLHNQTWSVEYLPAELVNAYQESFRTAGVELQGITTSRHVAVHAVPDNYVMDSGLVYAMYDLSLSAVEGFYFHRSRLIYHERFIIDEAVSDYSRGHEEQFRKMNLFKILDGIYRINADFEFGNPGSAVHKLLLCGTHPQIQEISDSLSDALGVEGLLLGLLLGDLDAVLPNAGRHALLTGYAHALWQGISVDFLHHDIIPQKALRVRTGVYIYTLTALLAFASVTFREGQFRKLSSELRAEKQKLSQLKISSDKSLKLAASIAALNLEIKDNAVFYGVFRDLANNLPDGIFLSGVTIKQLGSRSVLELLTVTRQSADIHGKKLLTRLQSYLQVSDYIRLSREPVITVIGKDNEKSVQIKVTCEVVPR